MDTWCPYREGVRTNQASLRAAWLYGVANRRDGIADGMGEEMVRNRKVLRVLAGNTVSPAPVWLMRQAGRYLPEYRQTRAKAGSFLDLCYNPALATEVTLQPIRRFGFEASILFSDILVVPHALGQKVWFVEGEGPRLDPISGGTEFNKLRDAGDEAIFSHLGPVFEAVSNIRAALPSETTLLGFCGGPWTVASYMIGGRGTPDLAPARLLASKDLSIVDSLIDRLVRVQTEYLIRQLRAGADAVQIFESHSGVLPNNGNEPDVLSRWSLKPIARMIEGVRREIPDAKIIVFCRGSGLDGHMRVVPETGANAVGVDWSVDLKLLRKHIPRNIVTQGNLHPETLIEGGYKLDAEIDGILEAVADVPHIFNLGHGITPQTPIAHVEQMLARIRKNQ